MTSTSILHSPRLLSSNSFRKLSTKAQHIEAAFKPSGAAIFLAAASSPESIPQLHGLPESSGGRANVGKSTLLNAVLGRAALLHTSKKAGRTRALNFFRVGREPGSLVVVDAPGYGKRGRAEWGQLWEHYIDTRAELRQICILINAGHGVTDFDRAMLADLNARLSTPTVSDRPTAPARHAPALQPVLTKLDCIEGSPDERARAVRAIIDELGVLAPCAAPPVLCAVSATMRFGIEAVRRAMAVACARES
ncbi:P-loop containing nucleoside triphosphate hydrolase protein [Phellopilus nigrolimitatus]|nr:P-loop containing nucleoside triphosphate hydrolase protein [Phellopilus nigrolimitatus]